MGFVENSSFEAIFADNLIKIMQLERTLVFSGHILVCMYKYA